MTDRARPVEIRVEADPDLDRAAPGDPVDSAPEPVADAPEPAAPPRRWRRRLVGGLVAAVVVGGLFVSEAVERGREAERAARLAAIPGVVGDLAVPPVPAWEGPPGWVLGMVEGGVATSVPVRASTSVAVYDTADGSVVWSRPMSPGGTEWCSGVVPEGVLCWVSAEGVGRRRGAAIVLDPVTGEERGRVEDVVVRAGAVGVEGGLVVLRDSGSGEITGMELALVDPVTGTATWTLPLADRFAGTPVEVDVSAVGDLVALLGPRTYVVEPATGEVVVDVSGRWGVVPVPGGFARRTGAHLWRVHDGSGAPQAEVPGQPVEPAVSDGSEPRVLVVTDGDAYRAVDRTTGEVLWSLPDDRGSLVMRREGAVVHVADDLVESVDLLTGEQRWEWRGEELAPSRGALSDGRVLMVVAHPRGDWLGHALDLDTGERLWTAPLPLQAAPLEFVIPGQTPRIEAVEKEPYTVAAHREVVWWRLPGAE